MKSTHSQRLERWIGTEQTKEISRNMRGWYGRPIPLLNLPGRVYACGDGDFCGDIKGGFYFSLADFANEKRKRVLRNWQRGQAGKLHAGLGSLSDLISEATVGGKRQKWKHSKTGTGTVSGRQYSLWNVGAQPAAGGAPAARPGGAVPTNATAGSLMQTDPGGSDTLHMVTWQSQATSAPNTLMIYDRLFHAATFNHNSSAAQTITGVPTRYATTTSPGNFAFMEVTTVLTATAFTITMQFVDQDGNAAENAAALTGIVSSVVTQVPHFPWFIPLGGVNTGLRNATQITFSAAAASGVSNFVMGHEIALAPQPVAGSMVVMDGINSAFNLEQVLTGACLSFMEWKTVASASTYMGSVIFVSG